MEHKQKRKSQLTIADLLKKNLEEEAAKLSVPKPAKFESQGPDSDCKERVTASMME